DAVALFSAAGVKTVFENLEGFPSDWQTNPEGFAKFVRAHNCPSFMEYGEYPFVSADEIKKALKLKIAFTEMLDQLQGAAVLARRVTGSLAPVQRLNMESTTELELDDIQSGVLRPRPTPYAATYIAFRIDDRKTGRELMQRASKVVTSAANPK